MIFKEFFRKDNKIPMYEVLGLIYNIKPVSVIDEIEPKEIKKIETLCKTHNLCYTYFVRGEHYSVVMSKDKSLLRKASYLSNKEKEDNSARKKFGLMLGYPECCVNKFINGPLNSGDIETEYKVVYSNWKMPISFLFNSFHGIFKLINHLPCSEECQHTKNSAQKLLKNVEKLSTPYTRLIENNLKKPVLIWNNYKKIIFEGEVSKKQGFDRIEYQNIIIYEPYIKNIKTNYDKGELLKFAKGNKVLVKKNNLNIYKDSKLIDIIERDNAALLRFG